MTDEDLRTIWCGNLSEKVTEDLLFQLFHQGGPLEKVRIPKDRDGRQRAFGFVTYKHVCSVPYALKLFEGTQLFNRELNLNQKNIMQMDTPPPQSGSRANSHMTVRQKTQSVPANIGTFSKVQNFASLLRFDQLNPSWSPASMLGYMPYASQLGGSEYLGGVGAFAQNSLSKSSLQGNWSTRNHPYTTGSGNKRNSRSMEHNHHYRRDDRGSRRGNC